MAKNEKKALNDEKLEQASGGMANPYWTEKPVVNTRPSIYATGRMKKIPDEGILTDFDWSKYDKYKAEK